MVEVAVWGSLGGILLSRKGKKDYSEQEDCAERLRRAR
jgi:hypothetical protein